MLRSVNDLKGFTIHALDGEIGKVDELFFDDDAWGIRYLVVETGSWLFERKVLISPFSIQGIDAAERTIAVALTCDQVKNSPDIDTHKPVSRRHELDFLRYYGYPLYWGGAYLWGVAAYPGFTPIDPVADGNDGEDLPQHEDVHLRSTDEVNGYHIHAADGSIGHVDDFVFDDEAWAIRYLVVDTRNWWPGKKVLIATGWIHRIDWTDSTVYTELTRDAIQGSPEYDHDTPIDRDYESALHEYYGRKGYWN